MMTLGEAGALIGRRAILNWRGLRIPVVIMDVRYSWGRIDCLVRAAGQASRWVRLESLTLHQ